MKYKCEKCGYEKEYSLLWLIVGIFIIIPSIIMGIGMGILFNLMFLWKKHFQQDFSNSYDEWFIKLNRGIYLSMSNPIYKGSRK